MKNQTLFSSKDKSKKLKCHLLQFLFGALRVRIDVIVILSVLKELKLCIQLMGISCVSSIILIFVV